MITNQEKILNYLFFFLLSLTGLSSLLLVKNNYLYIFILVFLLLYWQRFRVKQVLANYFSYPPSFPLFLTLGMVGVLFFQVFSPSPRFYQRPILTLIVSLVFYLPYFLLWYKLFLQRRVSLLGAFFLSGLGGILVFGIVFGKLTTTILTAPTLLGGLLYALLKAAGILTVVGILTAFPWLFFAEEKRVPPVPGLEKKNDSGFTLLGILLGTGLFLTALSLVGAARHRQNIAEQKLATIKQNRIERLSDLKQKVAEESNKTSPLLGEPTPTPTNIPIPKTPEGELQKPKDSGTKQPIPQTGTKTTRKTKEGRASKESQTQEGRTQAPSAKDERKQPKAQTGGDFSGQEMVDPATCQAVPSLAGCEIYYDPSIYYDPYSDPSSPEYQAQFQEQWYASQQDPSQLFFNDPVQLWSQDPFMYEVFEGIYNFNPVPDLPDLIPGFP